MESTGPGAVGCPEGKWHSEQRTAVSPGKAFPLLSWCSNRQNEDLAGASCRRDTEMEMSQKETKSVGRHREEGSLSKIKLVDAPSQLREPIAP